jgi:inner membrane protein
MATPVGHALVGATIGAALSPDRRLRPGIAVGALVGVAADLDFLPGLLLGAPGRYHHAQSHSLLFACLAGGAVMVVARHHRPRWGLLACLAYASHLLLDWFTQDTLPPLGIPILWPLTTRSFLSRFPLLPEVWRQRGLILSGHNAVLLALELALFLPPLLWVLRRRWHRHLRDEGARRGP